MALRIRQYVRYSIYSKKISAAEMSARLGLEPDRTRTLGTDGRPPRSHIWTLMCDDRGPGVDLTSQISTLVDRLRPKREALLSLVADVKAVDAAKRGAGHAFTIIRHFDADDGVLDGWQHRLLGWSIEPRDLRFLVDIGVSFGADEYGQDFSWWQWRAKRRCYAPIEYDQSDLINTGLVIRRNLLGRASLERDD